MEDVQEIVCKSIYNREKPEAGYEEDTVSYQLHVASKIYDEYQGAIASGERERAHGRGNNMHVAEEAEGQKLALALPSTNIEDEVEYRAGLVKTEMNYEGALTRARPKLPKAEWHPKWKLMRVISGHLGWVRALAVDTTNEFFASGSADRTIKIWDLASGTLKLSLTGHIATIRGLAISSRHPYLFSAAEDKMIKCWDLECNKVIRHYHGHLSGIYAMDLHPTLDLIVTAARDATARVWDMRSRQCVHVLSGHSSTIADVKCQEANPQVITSSMDSTVRLWDLAAGKTMTVLTHHKKSVRSLVVSQTDYTFASASADNIKRWRCPEGKFMHNFAGHNAIVNTMATNQDNVLFSGGDNGSMYFWDWKSGQCFQKMETIVQPGSLDSEAGIFCSTFDKTGLRLFTGEADKTIKVWKEDENDTPSCENEQ